MFEGMFLTTVNFIIDIKLVKIITAWMPRIASLPCTVSVTTTLKTDGNIDKQVRNPSFEFDLLEFYIAVNSVLLTNIGGYSSNRFKALIIARPLNQNLKYIAGPQYFCKTPFDVSSAIQLGI